MRFGKETTTMLKHDLYKVGSCLITRSVQSLGRTYEEYNFDIYDDHGRAIHLWWKQPQPGRSLYTLLDAEADNDRYDIPDRFLKWEDREPTAAETAMLAEFSWVSNFDRVWRWLQQNDCYEPEPGLTIVNGQRIHKPIVGVLADVAAGPI